MYVYSTVTSKLSVPVFPAASLAVHVTSVVPIENAEPDCTSHVGPDTTSLSSVAETEYVTIGVPFWSSVDITKSFGTLTSWCSGVCCCNGYTSTKSSV